MLVFCYSLYFKKPKTRFCLRIIVIHTNINARSERWVTQDDWSQYRFRLISNEKRITLASLTDKIYIALQYRSEFIFSTYDDIDVGSTITSVVERTHNASFTVWNVKDSVSSMKEGWYKERYCNRLVASVSFLSSNKVTVYCQINFVVIFIKPKSKSKSNWWKINTYKRLFWIN